MLSDGEIIDGKYCIVRKIGDGGMGTVYEAEATRIHRRVALKLLHTGTAPDVAARFEMEAQAAGRIGSPHIVDVMDLGDLPGGQRYMVMEYLEGESLGARLHRVVSMLPRALFPIAVQLLEALKAAHGVGIIHRDLKPDNVFLLRNDAGDFVKLVDFGVSKFTSGGSEVSFSMTRTGVLLGTPYYMSPEQARGAKELDHRTDLYSAGVIMYECLTGKVPFSAQSFNELMFKVALEAAPPIRSHVPDVDPAFAAIVTRAMAREPGERFQTALEFQEALVAWAARDPEHQDLAQSGSAAFGGARKPGSWHDSQRRNRPAHLSSTGAGSWSKGEAQPNRPDSVNPTPRRRVSRVWFAVIGVVVAAGGGLLVRSLAVRPSDLAAASPSAASIPSTPAVVAPAPLSAPSAPSVAASSITLSPVASLAPSDSAEPTRALGSSRQPRVKPVRQPRVVAAPAPGAPAAARPTPAPSPAGAADDHARTSTGRPFRTEL